MRELDLRGLVVSLPEFLNHARVPRRIGKSPRRAAVCACVCAWAIAAMGAR